MTLSKLKESMWRERNRLIPPITEEVIERVVASICPDSMFDLDFQSIVEMALDFHVKDWRSRSDKWKEEEMDRKKQLRDALVVEITSQ